MNAMRVKRRVYRSIQKHPGLRRFLKDPFIHGEIEGIVEDAELMGMDMDDPELMGGLIVNVVKKIAAAVRKRRAAKSGSSSPSFSMQTNQGTAALGPGGLTWTGQQNIPIGNTGMALQTGPQSESIIDKIKSNPALLAIPVGGIVLFMMMSKRGEKKK